MYCGFCGFYGYAVLRFYGWAVKVIVRVRVKVKVAIAGIADIAGIEAIETIETILAIKAIGAIAAIEAYPLKAQNLKPQNSQPSVYFFLDSSHPQRVSSSSVFGALKKNDAT